MKRWVAVLFSVGESQDTEGIEESGNSGRGALETKHVLSVLQNEQRPEEAKVGGLCTVKGMEIYQ